MKQIPLTQGYFTLVDDRDYEWLNQWKWYVCTKKRNGKKQITGVGRAGEEPKTVILMHREILGLSFGDHIQGDHINHNTLDNRRANLRTCTNAQNQYNQKSIRGKTCLYKGVHWDKYKKKWQALIHYKKKKINIGRFNSAIEAAKAYDKKARELFGDFACPNFVQEKDIP